jgi:hypothetical protein
VLSESAYIDVEEGEESEELVPFVIVSSFPAQISSLADFDHADV